MRTLFEIIALTGLAASASAQAFNWTLESPLTNPSPRERTATGTDGLNLYMFGGQTGSNTAGLDELWTYDGTDWTLQTASGTGPGPRSGAVGAYDVARGKFVVFGGRASFPGNNLTDTWEWDATNGWVQITTTVTPDGRWLVGHGTYVPGIGVVFHGGNAQDATLTNYRSNETWAFTGTDWALLSNTGPTVQNCSMVYRDVQGDLLLHGGQYGSTGTTDGETWRFDLGTGAWTQVVTTTIPESNDNTPSPMFGHLCYYNPVTALTIVHGGGDNTSGNKTYQFDGSDWSEITTNGPRCRNGGMHWVAVLGKAVYSPCNENNGTTFSRTRSHGPQVDAVTTPYGAGCNGQGGTPLSLAPDNAPWVGTTFTGTCTGMSVASPIKLGIWGFGTTALPITGILGAGPGCTLLTTADVIEVALSPATTHTVAFAIPADPALAGTDVHVQAGELDLMLGNLATSNGVSLTIGG